MRVSLILKRKGVLATVWSSRFDEVNCAALKYDPACIPLYSAFGLSRCIFASATTVRRTYHQSTSACPLGHTYVELTRYARLLRHNVSSLTLNLVIAPTDKHPQLKRVLLTQQY